MERLTTTGQPSPGASRAPPPRQPSPPGPPPRRRDPRGAAARRPPSLRIGAAWIAALVLAPLAATAAELEAQQEGAISGVVVASREDTARSQRSLLLKLGSRVRGQSVDRMTIELPDGVESPEVEGLPEGWTARVDDDRLEISGPSLPEGAAGYVRVGLGRLEEVEAPEELEVRLEERGREILEEEVGVSELPPRAVARAVEELLVMPPSVTPGETVRLTVLDPRRTPADGVWRIAGQPARPVGEAPGIEEVLTGEAQPREFRLEAELPSSLRPGDPVSVTYTDPWGQRLAEVEDAEEMSVRSPDREAAARPGPRLTDCSPRAFRGRTLCVCGYFPDPEALSSLTIGDRPLGEPLAASGRSAVFRLPEELPPGPYTVVGPPSAGFSEEDRARVEVLQAVGSIDQEELWRGESTTLRFQIRGTEEPLEIRLTNETPEIITMEGGADQVVATSGGAPNTLERQVTGHTVGNFRITYELEGESCPCAGEEQPRDTIPRDTVPPDTVPPEEPGQPRDTVPPPGHPEEVPDTLPPDTVTIPPEEPPPEEPPREPPPERAVCEAPQRTTRAEPAIRVTYEPPDPVEDYPYPRPIPLQLRARDYDSYEITCRGCGEGQGVLEHVVEDEIDREQVTWTLLDSLGSLNDPFRHETDLRNIEERIEETRREIREVQEELEEKREEKARADESRPRRRRMLQEEIDATREELDGVRARLDTLGAEIADREASIAEQETAMEEERARIEELEAEIDGHRAEIEALEEKLADEPGPEEERLTAEIEELEERIEAKQAELEQLRQRYEDREEELRQSLAAAEEELARAKDRLAEARQAVQEKQDEIMELERALAADPVLGQYLRHRYRIRRLAGRVGAAGGGPAGATPGEDPVSLARRFFSSADPERRRDLLERYRSAADRFLSGLAGSCGGLDPEARATCRGRMDELRREVEGLEGLMADNVEREGSELTARRLAQLQRLRRELAGLSDEADAAGEEVAAAQEAVNRELAAYRQARAEFRRERSTIQGEIEELEGRLSDKSEELEEARERRKAEYEENADGWRQQVADLRERIQEARAEIDRATDRIQEARQRTSELEAERAALREEREEARERRGALQERLARLEAQMEALEGEAERLEEEIEALEEEKARLEEELEDLRKEREGSGVGNMEAQGPLVYYVPPPLEEVLDDDAKADFEDRKDSVSAREAELAEARGRKAALQLRAFRTLKGMNRQLWALRAPLERVEALEEELDELKQQLDERKVSVTSRRQSALDSARQRRAELERERQAVADSASRAEQRVAEARREREEAASELQEARREVGEAAAEAEQARTEYRQAVEERRRAAGRLEEAKSELASTREELRELEAELGRAQDGLARAVSAGDGAAEARLRERIDELEEERTELERQRDEQKATVDRRTRAVEEATDAEAEARRELAEAELELGEAQAELQDARQELREKSSELEGRREERLRLERRQQETGRKLERADRRIDRLQEKLDAGPGDDGEVQALEARIAEKEEAKAEAEAAADEARGALDDLAAERDDWRATRDSVDREIREAEAALEDAREALRRFLEDEFDSVEFRARLKLKVTDKPLEDDWRAEDDTAEVIFHIRYEGERVPTLEPPDADLDPPPEAREPAPCVPRLAFDTAAQITTEPPEERSLSPAGVHEPQTIALRYREGRPLWPEWPQVERDEKRLMHASSPWKAGGEDADRATMQCTPAGGEGEAVIGERFGGGGEGEEAPDVVGEGGPACGPGPKKVEGLDDVVHHGWSGPDFVADPGESDTYLEAPEVPRDRCSVEKELVVDYSDSRLQADDDEKEDTRYETHAGLFTEVPDSLREFDADGKARVPSRVYEGAHVGLPGDTVRWRMTGSAPAGLDPTKVGLGPDRAEADTLVTDGAGYATVDFHLEERYGRATLRARWTRGGQACGEETVEVARLLELALLEVAFAPRRGWEQARTLWEGEGEKEALARALPDTTPTPTIVIGTGLRDDRLEPVNGRTIRFEASGAGVDPGEMETRIHGLAWSLSDTVPEEADVRMSGRVEEELADYTEPSRVDSTRSTETVDRFLIGPEGSRLTLEVQGDLVPGGDPWSGTVRLVVGENGFGLPEDLGALELEAEEIEVTEPEGDEDVVATAGTVSWRGEHGFTWSGFTFTVTRIGLSAGEDGVLEGRVQLPGQDAEPAFQAVVGPQGFYGEVGDFPEVGLGTMRLAAGASAVADFHQERDPELTGDLRTAWREKGTGVLIRSARLVLPDELGGGGEEPAALTAENLFVGEAGLSGTVGAESRVSAALGRLDFTLTRASLDFVQNEPRGGELEGEVTLPDPFVGTLHATVEVQSGGESYAVRVATDDPVRAPRYGLVFALGEDTGVSYREEVFTFRLSGVLESQSFSQVSVKGFEVDSEGDVEAEEIRVDEDVEFASGFSVGLNSLGFAYEAERGDYELFLDMRFQFSQYLESERTAVTIAPGPTIEAFETELTSETSAASFEATLEYRENLVRGDVGLDLKTFDQEVSGAFVLGTEQLSEEESYTYWYVEIASSARLPLGSTGLTVTELGGGLGYNYRPPIGQASGSPRHDETFSLKALMQVSDASGEVFDGRLTMALSRDRFSLNGKVWVLDREESLYGEGQLDLYWSPSSKLEGYVRMVTALPSGSGSILDFTGQVGFRYAAGNDWWIRSRTLEGSVLQAVQAEGTIEVVPGRARLDGTISYDVYAEADVAVVTVKVQADLEATTQLDIQVARTTSLRARARFHGTWDVNLATSVGDFDIVSGSIDAGLLLEADERNVAVQGDLTVSWETWVHSGSANVDVGYRRAA